MSDFAMCTRCDVATETSYNREGEKVCSQCGLIVESSLIVTEVQFAQDGSCTSTMVASNNKSTGNKKSRADGNMDRVLNRCKATQYSEQCFTVLHELQNKGTASRDTYLLAASVVLFVLKSNSKPYSITDIAKQAEVNIFDLGKVYKRVEDILKVQPDEVHHSQFVNRAIGSLQGLEERAASFIRAQADQLIAITKDHCFSTGRHPIAIIAGAVFVSLETYYAKKQTPLNHNYISNIAKSLVVAERTIKARSSEIKKLLIAKYNAIKDNLGIHIKVSKKNLNEVIPDLLMMIHGSSLNSNTTTDLQVSTSPTRPTDPPAFLHNQKLRERRSLKLDRAKQRLCSTLMGGQQSGEQLTEPDSTKQQKKRTFQEYDDEDRLIEMNLLQGVPDDAILTGYYNTDPNIGTPTVSSGDEELGEGDLPEEELYQFVRPDSEVDPENSLYDHSDVNQDKPSIHESPYKRRCFDLRN